MLSYGLGPICREISASFLDRLHLPSLLLTRTARDVMGQNGVGNISQAGCSHQCNYRGHALACPHLWGEQHCDLAR